METITINMNKMTVGIALVIAFVLGGIIGCTIGSHHGRFEGRHGYNKGGYEGMMRGDDIRPMMNKEAYNAMMKNNVDAKTPTVEATATDTATKQ